MDEDREKVVLMVIVVAVVIAAIFLISYRKTITIEVKDRYWLWQLSVKYDVVTYSTEETCTGSGSDRKCTTDIVRHVSTYTRCSDSASGRTLPPIKPQAPCMMWPSDYIEEDLTYHIVDSRDRTFPFEMWDYLEVGMSRMIRVNVFGNIMDKGQE